MIDLGTFACFHTVNSSSIGKIPKSKDKARGNSGAFTKSLVRLNQREPGTSGKEADDEDEVGSGSEAGENSRASTG